MRCHHAHDVLVADGCVETPEIGVLMDVKRTIGDTLVLHFEYAGFEPGPGVSLDPRRHDPHVGYNSIWRFGEWVADRRIDAAEIERLCVGRDDFRYEDVRRAFEDESLACHEIAHILLVGWGRAIGTDAVPPNTPLTMAHLRVPVWRLVVVRRVRAAVEVPLIPVLADIVASYLFPEPVCA